MNQHEHGARQTHGACKLHLWSTVVCGGHADNFQATRRELHQALIAHAQIDGGKQHALTPQVTVYNIALYILIGVSLPTVGFF